VDASSRDLQQQANVAICTGCGTLSGLGWAGWRAYRIDDPERDDAPALAFYCPMCVQGKQRLRSG
jgi:hypothetical protein